LLRYILWRIAMMVPTLLIISALVFTIIELPPGDYFESYAAELAAQGEDVNSEEMQALRQEYGFDQPPPVALFLLGRRHVAGRFRLFLRIPDCR
jgi:peptide/nickel transport system permease protein